jgi:osmotically-inducible protein OsmY
MLNKTLINQDQLTSDVRAHLAWDTRVDDFEIVVSVTGRGVSLSGAVASLYEKVVAEKIVYGVAGVSNVVNGLAVRDQPLACKKSDEAIQACVESTLACNHSLISDGVTVLVAHSCVTLSGAVRYLWQKRRVDEIVGDVEGVMDLCNTLEVLPPTQVSDEKIAVDISSAYGRSKFISEGEIITEVSNGQVTISGKVQTGRIREAVVSVVERTLGVVSLRNLVLVE